MVNEFSIFSLMYISHGGEKKFISTCDFPFVFNQRVQPGNFSKYKESMKPPWDSDEFMQPFDPEDELLQFGNYYSSSSSS